MKELKLGILGLSDGNGHPYSWSAICNGYDAVAMQSCPFPVIPEYLGLQNYPDDFLSGVRVSHIWTQDKDVSAHVAKCCHIESVAERYTDMIGMVDGILLARDDAENHLEMSRPFLAAGLPVYIDKPLATNLRTAEAIYELERYEGQIFSCSALRFAREFSLSGDELDNLGTLRLIDACVMKSWEKYAIHIIDPVLNILGDQAVPEEIKSSTSDGRKTVLVRWQQGCHTVFSTLGYTECPIVIRLFGDKGYRELVFEDTFFAFRSALQLFADSIRTGSVPTPKQGVLRAVSIIEGGMHG